MKLYALVLGCAFLVGCSAERPASAIESDAPSAAVEAIDPWLAKFKAVHGGEHDPGSRLDREKMAELKGTSVVKPPSTTAAPAAAPTERQAILNAGRKLIGTTEATGLNDGPVIEAIQKSARIGKGDPYCAAFNYWCYHEAGLAAIVPRSGWSPDWVSKPTWKQGAGRTPRAADTFGIYFAAKGRVAHTGLIEEWDGASAVTIEGNTSPAAAVGSAADRNGDGIWRKRRLASQIHSVRDWIGE